MRCAQARRRCWRCGVFGCSAEDIELLRGVGLDDVEIIDLLHAVAIFAWANRLMQNLGEAAPAAA